MRASFLHKLFKSVSVCVCVCVYAVFLLLVGFLLVVSFDCASLFTHGISTAKHAHTHEHPFLFSFLLSDVVGFLLLFSTSTTITIIIIKEKDTIRTDREINRVHFFFVVETTLAFADCSTANDMQSLTWRRSWSIAKPTRNLCFYWTKLLMRQSSIQNRINKYMGIRWSAILFTFSSFIFGTFCTRQRMKHGRFTAEDITIERTRSAACWQNCCCWTVIRIRGWLSPVSNL